MVFFFIGAVGTGLVPSLKDNQSIKVAKIVPDKSFGWKFPIAKFPLTGSNGKLITYSAIRDPGGIPRGLPVRLQIPVIGIDSAVEDALITPDGRMDVPAGSVNVAWFSLGPHPGEVGSAVIGGHFGIDNGIPFVFYNLDKLRIGDKVYIVDDEDNTLAFVVRAIKSFDRNGDSTTVFTSQDGLAHLNLITCEGVWNQVNGTYPQRLVVFTDAIPSESSLKASTVPITSILTTSTSILTPTVIPTISPPVPTVIPTTENTSPSSLQTVIASAQSLYITPINAFITFFLLSIIGFMIFKIIKR